MHCPRQSSNPAKRGHQYAPLCYSRTVSSSLPTANFLGKFLGLLFQLGRFYFGSRLMKSRPDFLEAGDVLMTWGGHRG